MKITKEEFGVFHQGLGILSSYIRDLRETKETYCLLQANVLERFLALAVEGIECAIFDDSEKKEENQNL